MIALAIFFPIINIILYKYYQHLQRQHQKEIERLKRTYQERNKKKPKNETDKEAERHAKDIKKLAKILNVSTQEVEDRVKNGKIKL